MAPELKAAIDELINRNKVVVFMKGTKQFPQCGFSNTVVQVRRPHARAARLAASKPCLRQPSSRMHYLTLLTLHEMNVGS